MIEGNSSVEPYCAHLVMMFFTVFPNLFSKANDGQDAQLDIILALLTRFAQKARS